MAELFKLPEEMALQVLIRLPSKSLMRFKCVRKSWYTMINNPVFVNMHLSNHSMTNNNLSLSGCIFFKRSVLKNTETDEKETLFTLLNFRDDNDGGDDEDNKNIFYIAKDISKDQFHVFKDLEAVSICGHCDGIICLASSSHIVLWNPSTMEFSHISLEPNDDPDLTLGVLGFGCDPKSRDFKVVNIVRPGEEEYDEHLLYNPPITNLYTFSTDSWRQINTDTLETETTNFWPQCFQMYHKGFCYWTGKEQLKEFVSAFDPMEMEEEYIRDLIISFDMANEVFHHTLFPDNIYESNVCWYIMSVIVWNESVALFGYFQVSDNPVSMALWAMDGFGGPNGGSWIQLYTFGPLEGGVTTPLRSWKSDEILMVSKDGRIVAYNVDIEEHRYLPICSMESADTSILCVDSIVPLTRSKAC